MSKKEKYNYFDEFIEVSECILKSSQCLKHIIIAYNYNDLNENIQVVHDLENEADKKLHELKNYLIKDFLPPIDREDISLIGHRLDDIEDDIDEILINFKILNITSIRDDIKEFIELLEICANCVKDMFLNFKNFKKVDLIKSKVIEMNNLEEKGDRIFEKAMSILYKEEMESLEIIKWTTIYNCFEKTFDDCEKIGDSVEDVLVKNS